MGRTSMEVGAMPKEVIYSKYHGSNDSPEPVTEVRWTREHGYVQVATTMPDGHPFPVDPTPEGNGWFATLNRENINHLIRTLRKARDQAFGADA